MRIVPAALLGFVFAYMLTVGFRPLAAPDEFRYGEIAREMEVSGNRLSPRILGLRYYEKPVLTHQLNWLSIKIFGQNSFALRFSGILLTALTGAMTAALVWRRRRDGKLAGMAFGFYASFLWVYMLGTTALTDAPLAFFTTAALYCAFLAVVEGDTLPNRLGWCLLAALALVGGFFTKGAVAIALPGLSVFGFILWEKRYREIFRVGIPIILFAAVAALPLSIAIHRADPDFWRYFIFIEHIQRFTAEAGSQHPEPWYFLWPFLAIGALPGLIFLPCWVKIGKSSWQSLLSYPIYKLALCAVILPMIFLSCSSGKLPTYILPCFPALAILFAGGLITYLRECPDHRIFNLVIRFWAKFLIVAGLVAGGVAIAFVASGGHRWIKDEDIRGILTALVPLVIGCGAAGILGGALLLYFRNRRRTTVMTTFFLTLALLTGVVNLSFPEVSAGKFPARAMRIFRTTTPIDWSKATIVTTSTFLHALAWGFGRDDIRGLNSMGELEYGEKAAKNHGETTRTITTKELLSLIAQPQREPVAIITYYDYKRIPNIPQKPKLTRRHGDLLLSVY